jgi:type I restriction enzyme S subunit
MPGTDEQAAIARVLDAVDASIERAREALKATKTLHASLIIELLAVGVGQNGCVRNASDSPDEFLATMLGRLPRSWRLSDIRTEFQLQNGITLNEAQRARRPKWRYLRVANVQRDALALEDVQVLEASEAEATPRLLAEDDLLVVEGHADRMQIGRCAIVTMQAVGMTFQNHLFRLRSNGAVVPAFGCLWLNSWQAQRYWNAMCATSSGLNTINQRMLKRVRIPVPPPDEQKQIVEIATTSKNALAANRVKLSALQELKKSLMHDLLTGTVRVDPTLFKEQQ